MELLNFHLVEERGNIEINALGEVWNLHDAFYSGLHHRCHEPGLAVSHQVELFWEVDPARYSAAGFSLLFHEVNYFEVTPRDNEMPVDEDTRLDSVAKVMVEVETSEIKPLNVIGYHLADTEEFHIYFRFRGGQTIRIDSRTAKFVKTI